MSGTLYTSRIRACSLYCPSAQRVTSITNKYIALGNILEQQELMDYDDKRKIAACWTNAHDTSLLGTSKWTNAPEHEPTRTKAHEGQAGRTESEMQHPWKHWKLSNPRSQQCVCWCCGLNIMPHESEATIFPKTRSRVSLKTFWRWTMQFYLQTCIIVAGQENINWAWHLHVDDKHIHGLRIHPMAFKHYCRKTTSPIRPPN